MTQTISPALLGAFDPENRRRVSEARTAFFSDIRGIERTAALRTVRPEIVHSWTRSLQSGVNPHTMTLPSRNDGANSSRLVLAAEPIMARLCEQLDGSPVWGMLLDRDCIQLGQSVGSREFVEINESRGSRPGAVFSEHVVGTNGAGMSVERLLPSVVIGPEHFRDSEQNLVSVGAPIRDSLNRLVGVLSLNCYYAAASTLLIPFARDVAWAIRERLSEEAHRDERELFAVFTHLSKRPSQPVIAVSESIYIASSAARQLFQNSGETESITRRVLDAVAGGADRDIMVVLRDGEVLVRCRAVELSEGQFGAVALVGKVSRGDVSATAVSLQAQGAFQRLTEARNANQPVSIRGERGTGKSRLARTIIGDAPSDEFDGLAAVVRPKQWLAELHAALADPQRVVIIKHLDEVDTGVAAAVAALIRGAHAYCVGTMTTPVSDDSLMADLMPVSIEIPPLRQRPEEIPQLVSELLLEREQLDRGGESRTAAPSTRSCSSDVIAAFMRYPWRGNVAQLKRVLNSAAAQARRPEIALEDLPAAILADTGGRALTKFERHERELLFEALTESSWNREAAATLLGISRATMYRKIKQFGIRIPSSRA